MSEAVLSVQNLSVELGENEIVSSVSLAATEGELVGLIGPNGAGKTTFLRAVQGLIRPTQGSVTVVGQTVNDLSARAKGRQIASVPQEIGLSFPFPVREAVAMGRNPHIGRFGSRNETDERKIRTALEKTELTAFADRPVTELSGGERQRVLLARAFAQDTPLLLLDEPTANLDINHAVNTLDMVRSAIEGDTAAIAAIHDLDLAARYCDRLVLFVDGAVLAVGPPESVLTRDRLRTAFGIETVVSPDPTTGAPRVTALSAMDPSDERH